MSRIITLLTDFGERDGYVAAMKGVILNIAPTATLVDITHEIGPQDIKDAAFVIDSAFSYFPSGTVHVIVVDPGVGSRRRAVLVRTPGHYFLAPDTGLLSYVLARWLPTKKPGRAGETSNIHIPHDSPIEAYSLTNRRYFLPSVSQTFHGRDLFSPVAAHLSTGVMPEEMGERINSLVAFDMPAPELKGDLILGQVIHVDRFGNLITNIFPERTEGEIKEVRIGPRTVAGLSRSYAEGGELLAIAGSSGRLEIAAKNASAAALLGLGVGAEIRVVIAAR